MYQDVIEWSKISDISKEKTTRSNNILTLSGNYSFTRPKENRVRHDLPEDSLSPDCDV